MNSTDYVQGLSFRDAEGERLLIIGQGVSICATKIEKSTEFKTTIASPRVYWSYSEIAAGITEDMQHIA